MGKREKRIKYKSASILLDLAKLEYSSEDERTKGIDNRVGFLFSALIVLLTFYFPNIKFSVLFATPISSFTAGLPIYVLLSLHLATLVLAFLSLHNLRSAISVKIYARISNDDFKSRRIAAGFPDEVSLAFVDRIADNIARNEKSNDAKVSFYMRGMKYLILMIASMAITTIVADFLIK